MIAPMRARLLVALGLSCAIAPATACKKNDADASSVDDETRKKPQPHPSESAPPPPPKVKKEFIPDHAKYKIGGGSCQTGWFCTNAPEIVRPDAGPVDPLIGKVDLSFDAACGPSAKVPAALAITDGAAGMAASFNERVTKEVRVEEPDTCCYAYRAGPCGKGRPMRHEGELVLAGEVRRAGWTGDDAGSIAADVRACASETEVEALATHLRHVAILEHASVAAFARVSLELLALGAPSRLVTAAHVAALDEIRHAQLCWSLLAALEGSPRGPTSMDLPPFGTVDRRTVLVSTVVDGCVGETIGALLFQEAARLCEVPSLAALYRTIAAEEETHAALAFEIVRFLVEGHPELAALARSLASAAAIDVATESPSARLGGLDHATQRAVQARGLSDVVLPVLLAVTDHGSL